MADWFRSPDWSTDAEQDFEARLRRARPGSRAQYLRIKALTLEEHGDSEAAAMLLQRIIDDHADAWTEVAFAQRLGDLCRGVGDLAGAEGQYRAAMAVSPSMSGTTGELHVKLGEVLLESGRGTITEIEQLLIEARSHATFNSTAFRVNVLTARVAAATGDVTRRRHAAAAALDLIGAPPQFPRHRTVGLVDAEPLLRSELRAMASE